MAFEKFTKIGVILFALLNAIFLSMCCGKQYSEVTPPTLLKFYDVSNQLQPCEIEGKKIYYYKKVGAIGRLVGYHGYSGVQDKGGLLYEDINGLHPLMSFLTPFQQGWGINFSIISKQNQHIIYYQISNEENHLDSIFIENNPFLKDVVIKELKPSFFNERYLKKFGCFMGSK